MTDSETVRTALREAANQRRTRAALAEEARALARNKDDCMEMRIIREQMAELAPGIDD